VPWSNYNRKFDELPDRCCAGSSFLTPAQACAPHLPQLFPPGNAGWPAAFARLGFRDGLHEHPVPGAQFFPGGDRPLPLIVSPVSRRSGAAGQCGGLRPRSLKQLARLVLYDAEGSRLFDANLRQRSTPTAAPNRPAGARSGGDRPRLSATAFLLSFGAGQCPPRCRPCLEALAPAAYVALDISSSHLGRQPAALSRPPSGHRRGSGICCDYSQVEGPAGPSPASKASAGSFLPRQLPGQLRAPQARALLARVRPAARAPMAVC